jgi:hypothetical protein
MIIIIIKRGWTDGVPPRGSPPPNGSEYPNDQRLIVYIFIYLCMYTYMDLSMYIYVCIYVYINIIIHEYSKGLPSPKRVWILQWPKVLNCYLYIYLYLYINAYGPMDLYIRIYIYVYMHIPRGSPPPNGSEYPNDQRLIVYIFIYLCMYTYMDL